MLFYKMTLTIKTINTAALNVKLTSFEPEYKEDLIGSQLENDQDEPGNTYVRISEVNLKSALDVVDNDQYRIRIEHPEIIGGETPSSLYNRRNVVNFTTSGTVGTDFVDDKFNAKLQTFPSYASNKGTSSNMTTYKETGSTNVSYLYVDNPLADYINYNNTPYYSLMSNLTTPILSIGGTKEWNYATNNDRINNIIPGVSAFGTDVGVMYLPVGDATLDSIVGASSVSAQQGFIVVEQDSTFTQGSTLPTVISSGTPVSYGGLSVNIYKHNGYDLPSDGTRTIYYFRGTSQPTLTVTGSVTTVTSPNPVEVGKICVINGISVTITVSTTGNRQITAPSLSEEKTKIIFANSTAVRNIRFFKKVWPSNSTSGFFTNIVINDPPSKYPDPGSNGYESDDYLYTSRGSSYSIYPSSTSPLKIKFRDTLFVVEDHTALEPVLTDLPSQFFETDGYIVCLIPIKESTGNFYETFLNSVNIHDSVNLVTAAAAAPALTIPSGQATVNSLPVTSLKILFLQYPDIDENIVLSGPEFLNGGFTVTGGSLNVNVAEIQNAIGTDWNISKTYTTSSASFIFSTTQSYINTITPGIPGTSTYHILRLPIDLTQYDPLNLDSVRSQFHGIIFFKYSSNPFDFSSPVTTIVYKENEYRPKTYNLRYDDPRLLAAYPGTNLKTVSTYAKTDRRKLFTKSRTNEYIDVFNSSDRLNYHIFGNILLNTANGLAGLNATLIDFSFLGSDYINNDIFYISSGPTDKFYSETAIVLPEPVLIGQFKKRLTPTELTYRCILEYNNGTGWKKVIDSDTAEFSMQYSTMSISDGGTSYFNARTLVTEEVNFTEATVYTNNISNVGLFVSILGSTYTIKNVSVLSSTLPRLYTILGNKLTEIDNEVLGGRCAIILVFPEMNVANTLHSLMDSNTGITSPNFERTYKTIVGFGNVTSPTMYYNSVAITTAPDVKFKGTIFNLISSNMLPLPSESSTILSIVNNFNSTNDENFSYPNGVNPLPDIVLVVPQFRQKQDHIVSSGNATTSYSIKVYLNTSVTKPILHSRLAGGNGNWVDVSFIPGLSKTLPTAIRADSNTGFSNYTINANEADYVLELGSNHITGVGLTSSNYVTVPSSTLGTLYYAPIVSPVYVPVIFGNGPGNGTFLYHKSGVNPKTVGVGRNLFTAGTLLLDQETAITSLLGEMTLVRSVQCPSDVALTSVISNTLFTNASFTTLAADYILLVISPSVTNTGTVTNRTTGVPLTSPIYFATKTIYVENNTSVTLTSTTSTVLTTSNNILVVMNRSLFSSTQNIYTNEKDYVPTSSTNPQQMAVLDDLIPAGNRDYELNIYDSYIYVVSDEPATQSYEFVDDNVKIISSSGYIDALQYIKTKRSSTTVNREGQFSVQLFKGTPLVIFTGLKWSIASINRIEYNYNNSPTNTVLTIDRQIYERGTIYLKTSPTDAYYTTIKLVHYDLITPSPSGETKELAIVVTAGNTIKNLKIIGLNIIHENKDIGTTQFKFDL